jgi:hypothetical protein
LTHFRQLCYKSSEIDNSRGDLRQLAPRKKTAKEPLGFREISKNPAHSSGAGFLIFRAFENLALISPCEPIGGYCDGDCSQYDSESFI